MTRICAVVLVAAWAQAQVNSVGMRMVRLEAGSFAMGEGGRLDDGLLEPLTYPTRGALQKRFPEVAPAQFRIPFEARRHGDFDERPVHRVRISKGFSMSATEVTNAQYEMFDPSHRALRGKRGFSTGDDEAVVEVNWHEAVRFCEWLSKREGIHYRLPTEAEWEYAARAGTATAFSTGSRLPASMLKNARSTDFTGPGDVVMLTVARSAANAWGLFDMHGNVEEWVADWYGAYAAGEADDPHGPVGGEFKVTRGGSHGTDEYYLRSANRSGALPALRSFTLGFRVVAGDVLKEALDGAAVTRPTEIVKPKIVRGPFFRGPLKFVKIPEGSHGPLYSHHNHDTAIAECPNGDLLAIWYTCEQERGRELAVASSRLKRGAREWSAAELFWDVPDRNDHCPALWFDGDRTLYHFNGLAVAARWLPLAIVMRTSTDNGMTWSAARLIAPDFGYRNMVGQPVFRLSTGAIAFGADAGRGSTVWMSEDEGKTWRDTGGDIRGVHAGVAELRDGSWLGLGRGQDVDGWMAQSRSRDKGANWEYAASPLPPIGGGQRSVLMRLKSGPLLYCGFAEDVGQFRPIKEVAEARGGMSLFAALSYDEGKTWPVRRVISGAENDEPGETIDGGRIRRARAVSEPQGYLAATEARDGVVHLISSINHYAFNREWLEKKLKPSRAGRAPMLQKRPEALLWIEVDATGEGTVELWEPKGALVTQHYKVPVTAGHWRIVVRADTAAQIYQGSAPALVVEPQTVIDWPLAARGRWLSTTGAITKAAVRE